MKNFQLKALACLLMIAMIFAACEQEQILPSPDKNIQLPTALNDGKLQPVSDQNSTLHSCATHDESIELKNRYPEYYDEQHPAHMKMKQIYENSNNEMSFRSSGPTYTIPVVFHVLWDTYDGTVYGDIQASQIDRAMEILNEDFNQNNNQSDVPSGFLGIAGNVNLEFVLAEKDPEGVCLTEPGIERINTNYVYDGSQGAYGDYIKTTWHWPADKYLNVYLVDYINGASGYAILPGVAALYPAQYDGIVLDYSYLGDIEEAAGNVYPHTLTHEVGHWAGLNHTWGTGTVGVSTNCSDDDGISDTPLTVGNYNSSHPANCSTSNTSCGSNDNIHNFMDYSCQLMYTNGQVSVMRGVLESDVADRNNLWTTSNLNDVMNCDGSGGNNSCDTPAASDLTFGPPSTQVYVYAQSYYGITHQIRYKVSGGSWTTFSATTSHYNTITNLQNCVTYEVQIRQQCDGTWSEWSASATLTNGSLTAPVFSDLSNPTVGCNYAHTYCQNHQGDQKTFQLRKGNGTFVKNKYTTSHYRTFTGLTPNTVYKYRVRKKCGTTGSWSTWTSYKYFTTTSCN